MKKISILLVICMLLSVSLMACNEAEEITHTHEYAEAWSFDAANHYHMCTCGEKADSAAHADANNDGACDTCAVIMSNNHVYDKEWTSNETDHWHASLCGHDVIDGKATHTSNKMGKCSVCGYKLGEPKMTTIEEAIALAAETQGDVRNGFLTRSFGSGEYLSQLYTWYEYGENYLHVFDVSEDKNYYATLNEDGSVFYMTVSDDPISPIIVDENADETYMAGPEINISNITGNDELHYGPISIIERLYTTDEALEAEDFEEKIEDGVYSFSYTGKFSFYGQPTNIKIEVSFEFAPDTYILKEVNISSKEGSSLNSLNFTQSIEPINDHKPEMVLPVSYDLTGPDGKALQFTDGKSNTVNAVIGDNVFKFTDIEPATALIDVLGVSIMFVDDEGNEILSGAYATSKNGVINVKVFKEGDYNMLVKVGDTEYLVPIKAAYATPTKLDVAVYNELYNEYSYVNSYNMYEGGSIVLTASVANGCEPNRFTARIKGSNASNAKLTESAISGDNGDIKSYVFTSTKAGTYTVEFTSEVDERIKASFTITVDEAPEAKDLANGKYTAQDGAYIVNFYPDNDANTSGTATAYINRQGSENYITFTYTIKNGVFEATPDANHNNAALEISDNYEVQVGLYWYSMVTLEYVGEADDPSAGGGSDGDVEGAISSGTQFNENDNEGGTYKMVIGANGTGNISIVAAGESISSYSITITWETENITATVNGVAITSGDSIDFDDINWNQEISFKNNSGEKVVLEFTLTWANA